ncbi:hypothetical protein [Nostoc sp. 'Peltigera membranacea cyanobiont' N6]|uniref:hypothetical protein n=1 Tax=Nostoc sp. 'Peltigera membranacea cyanobiont' N6 TaxID=1261031 RepID=UPI0015E3853B|nr:hypothetical protein [Nostoc sp. 'Peltigera membranacea cyanobiont' N6]
MDEILSGVRSAIAVKIYGSELEQLRIIGKFLVPKKTTEVQEIDVTQGSVV